MSSLLNTYDRVLAILNEEMGSVYARLDEAYSALQRRVLDASAIGVCGYPCVGDCRTCLEAGARLESFFAPDVRIPICSDASASVEGSGPTMVEDSQACEGSPHVQIMVYAGDEDRELENMRSMDMVDDMYRNPYAYDDGYVEDEYDEETAYYDDRYYDDGGDGGLDWNESGYFD
jgi:hypothetical protein